MFTWSNKRHVPTLSRLDRVFLTGKWSANYPDINLMALEVIISDHAPLLLTCKHLESAPKQFRFEKMWMRYQEASRIVKQLWAQSLQPINDIKLQERITQMQSQLRRWHQQHLGRIEQELLDNKKQIKELDRLEEVRHLNNSEFLFRQGCRENAYYLSTIIEERWVQRARCQWWFSEGDNNTRFFHSYASSRLWKNKVLLLEVDGVGLSDETRIQQAFFNHMKGILGVQSEVISFDPSVLYDNGPDLSSLPNPFSIKEVEETVLSLANNRASGPDGLPNEFAKLYWPDIKSDIMGLINGFYEGSINIEALNTVNIVMIPKREGDVQLKEFRPISIISLVPKIISKLLAMRLASFLPALISINQTTFVKGRQISENFVALREVLQHISQAKEKAVFLKIDFAKAFDSVS